VVGVLVGWLVVVLVGNGLCVAAFCLCVLLQHNGTASHALCTCDSSSRQVTKALPCTQMVGIWCVVAWQQLGCPSQLQLVELGPGRGTLMADLLRGTAAFKPFADALQVVSAVSTLACMFVEAPFDVLGSLC
jgi:hypothetical protein